MRLRDGTRAVVRPIRPDDKALLDRGMRRLTPESAHRRFLAPKPSLTAAELTYLTEVDGRDHVALVVVEAADPDSLMAVGRCVRLQERADTAIALHAPVAVA